MKRFLIASAAICIIAACNNKPSTAENASDTAQASMSTSKTDMLEKNKQTALATQQAINDHNVDGVMKDAAQDMVDYGDGNGAPVKGVDSCRAFVNMFLTAFPDLKGENLMAIAEGKHVAVFGDWSGTFKGEMMGMKPTGRTFHVKDVDLFTFNDEGKITEHRSVQSFQTMMMQVGAAMK